MKLKNGKIPEIFLKYIQTLKDWKDLSDKREVVGPDGKTYSYDLLLELEKAYAERGVKKFFSGVKVS